MGSGKDYGTCTQCIRFTFIGCNIFFCVLSILGFIIGIWSVANANNSNNSLSGDSVSFGAIFLTSSIISFGLCVIGIVGGVKMWRPFLIAYAIILLIVVILGFVSAIVAFVYSGRARGIVEDNFEDAIRDYCVDGNDCDEDDNEGVDDIQENLKCCGINNASDWLTYNDDLLVPPDSCDCDRNDDDDCVRFRNTNTFVWEDGCLDVLEAIIRVSSIVVGVVSIIIMLIEITFVLVAVGLIISITRSMALSAV